ncbi:tRNA (Guanine37-N(1)-) methyltransferase [Microlunatus sagamiharensis]|uniref:tRNA (guanine-N(1)-)-methyltransferase n=1 Tax=Microlunatus sagamiharensis TaxID=546874 RepID=A0A1H2LVS5_9ACTN|nr:tRNA (guanosine(37)-N1)-methyltransferase TrmD [Microlunatus sagamiharensis]SDU84825.1 tRNA (Guanine37-N(1)-) methyltransferase [Microlunatus sagamiharensis]
MTPAPALRADVVTIFPDYLAPLRLSLIGRAARTGILDLAVHDLRTWTHDRHRTVDDTPYGGGAGMVMKPEPWGEALDALVPAGADPRPRLVVPTPSGRPFTQAVAVELAAEPHLVFACGRYEGIDSRVAADAATRMRVDEVSIGDYVLNGGEVAVLVMLEAVVRLLPGVVGNPASLTEESHAAEHDGLLEGPVFTKPTSWRGLDVPPVLLSGDHGAIARWRREQALERTRRVRPELAPAPLEGRGLEGLTVSTATPADAGEILTLQRAAFVAEARINDSLELPPLTQTLEELAASLLTSDTVLVVRQGTRIVATARVADRADGTWWVSRLMVAPDQQGRGLGSALLRRLLEAVPPGAAAELLTGAASRRNLALYRRFGFRVVSEGVDEAGVPVVTLRREPKA